nr:hypothetical protein [uncultured Rhodopila sp.]
MTILLLTLFLTHHLPIGDGGLTLVFCLLPPLSLRRRPPAAYILAALLAALHALCSATAG